MLSNVSWHGCPELSTCDSPLHQVTVKALLTSTKDFGFVLPPEQIRGSAEEMWAGMQVMLSLLDEEFFDGQGPAVGA